MEVGAREPGDPTPDLSSHRAAEREVAQAGEARRTDDQPESGAVYRVASESLYDDCDDGSMPCAV